MENIEEISKMLESKTHESLIKLRAEIGRIESLFSEIEVLSELADFPLEKITTEDADYTKHDEGKDTIEGHRKVLTALCNNIIRESDRRKD